MLKTLLQHDCFHLAC